MILSFKRLYLNKEDDWIPLCKRDKLPFDLMMRNCFEQWFFII